jgi:hypothetical protein
MTITRATQYTARAALLEPLRIEPFLDPCKAGCFVAVVLHEINPARYFKL